MARHRRKKRRKQLVTLTVAPLQPVFTCPQASHTTPFRYPLLLGLASLIWAITGWMLALHAPAIAFWPAVEWIHIALPALTGVLILFNLWYALFAWRKGMRIDRLTIITALQIGLFTTLFHQIAAHIGAEHFKVTEPTTPGQWVQFSLAHALKASDVLDTIEAYGLNIQVVKHNGWFVATLLVIYHAIVDLFVLGLLWALFGAVKEKVMSEPGLADIIGNWLIVAFLAFLVAWLASAFLYRPWQRIDIPLWLAENVVRVLDFPDFMDSYDVHWHQVPKDSWWECTLTVICRLWIALGIGLLRDQLRATRPTDETPSLNRVARLAFVGVLFAGFIGLPKLFPSNAVESASNLVSVASDANDARAVAALNALRRMGPNAEVAIEPLAALLPSATEDRRTRIVDTLGHLGPKALSHVAAIAEGKDVELALVAAKGLHRIGTDAAPALVRVWKHTPNDVVRELAAESLRGFGLDAMPKLIAAVTRETSAEYHHWFDQLDRNWVLRRDAGNEVFRILVRLRNRELKTIDDIRDAQFAWHLETPALTAVLNTRDEQLRQAAAEVLARVPADPNAIPALCRIVSTESLEKTRIAAINALASYGELARPATDALLSVLARVEFVEITKAALVRVNPSWRQSHEAAVARSRYITDLGSGERDKQDAALRWLFAVDPNWEASPSAIDAVPNLLSHLEDDRDLRFFRVFALEALAGIARKNPNVVQTALPELFRALRFRDRETGCAVCGVLAAVGPMAAPATRELATLLKNDDDLIQCAAANALGSIGAAAKDAIPELLAELDDKRNSSNFQLHIAHTLSKFGSDANVAVEPLVKSLGNRHRIVHSAALEALDSIDPAWTSGPHAAAAVPHLIKLLNVNEYENHIRRRAALTCGRIGPAARTALPALSLAAHDNWGKVGEAAKKAIAQINRQ